MTKQELIQRLGISDQKLEELKVIVQTEVDDAMQCIEDRIPDIFTIANDDEWEELDQLAAILVKEFISDWKTEE